MYLLPIHNPSIKGDCGSTTCNTTWNHCDEVPILQQIPTLLPHHPEFLVSPIAVVFYNALHLFNEIQPIRPRTMASGRRQQLNDAQRHWAFDSENSTDCQSYRLTFAIFYGVSKTIVPQQNGRLCSLAGRII